MFCTFVKNEVENSLKQINREFRELFLKTDKLQASYQGIVNIHDTSLQQKFGKQYMPKTHMHSNCIT